MHGQNHIKNGMKVHSTTLLHNVEGYSGGEGLDLSWRLGKTVEENRKLRRPSRIVTEVRGQTQNSVM